MKRATSVVLAACGLLLHAAPSAAQETDVETLIRQGVEARIRHEDAAAADLFRRAFAQGHGARAQAQLGLAEQALGQWVAAQHDLHAALASGDPWVASNRAALERSTAEVDRHVGALEVAGGAPGAQVRIDGVPVGTLPLASPVALPAGTVTLEVERAGFYTVRRTVTITGGQTSREFVELRPRAAENEGNESAGTAAVTHTGTATVIAPRGETAVEPARGTPTLVYAGLVGGAVFLVGGIVANVVREREAAAWNSDACLTVDPSMDRLANCGGHHTAVDVATGLAVVGYVAGGALLVGAVIGMLTAGHEPPPRSARFGCGVGPGAVGVACAGAF